MNIKIRASVYQKTSLTIMARAVAYTCITDRVVSRLGKDLQVSKSQTNRKWAKDLTGPSLN